MADLTELFPGTVDLLILDEVSLGTPHCNRVLLRIEDAIRIPLRTAAKEIQSPSVSSPRSDAKKGPT
jgi:hypothetical protein